MLALSHYDNVAKLMVQTVTEQKSLVDSGSDGLPIGASGNDDENITLSAISGTRHFDAVFPTTETDRTLHNLSTIMLEVCRLFDIACVQSQCLIRCFTDGNLGALCHYRHCTWYHF